MVVLGLITFMGLVGFWLILAAVVRDSLDDQ